MTTVPRTPRFLKGAIVGIDPLNPLASVIVFQYNPDTLTRSIEPQMGSDGGDKGESLRFRGAPAESIKLDVEIDATDQLEGDRAPANSMGVYPQLSALEMLVYPKTPVVLANSVLLALGTIEVIPPVAPLTLFVWGPKRALPVRIKEFTIAEEAYDASLNPIRAKVSLGLRVLSYNDLPLTHPGNALFVAHQVAKEAMAVIGSAGSLSDIGGVGL